MTASHIISSSSSGHLTTTGDLVIWPLQDCWAIIWHYRARFRWFIIPETGATVFYIIRPHRVYIIYGHGVVQTLSILLFCYITVFQAPCFSKKSYQVCYSKSSSSSKSFSGSTSASSSFSPPVTVPQWDQVIFWHLPQATHQIYSLQYIPPPTPPSPLHLLLSSAQSTRQGEQLEPGPS